MHGPSAGQTDVLKCGLYLLGAPRGRGRREPRRRQVRCSSYEYQLQVGAVHRAASDEAIRVAWFLRTTYPACAGGGTSGASAPMTGRRRAAVWPTRLPSSPVSIPSPRQLPPRRQPVSALVAQVTASRLPQRGGRCRSPCTLTFTWRCMGKGGQIWTTVAGGGWRVARPDTVPADVHGTMTGAHDRDGVRYETRMRHNRRARAAA